MVSKRFNPQDFLVGMIKLVCGVAIALLVISLAGAATARYFLTQLANTPERPVFDNDAPVADAPAATDQTSTEPATPAAPAQPAPAASAPEINSVPETKALYNVVVTYGAGLLIRSGPGAEYGTIGGIDYDDTIEVLEESGRWFRVRADGVEGWIKGQGNTQRL